MAGDRDFVRRRFEALMADAEAQRIPRDVVGRLLLLETVEMWKAERSLEDIESELRFVIESLDPDTDYEFMRP